MLKFLKALAIFMGTVIGAGVFGIPYVVEKSGLLPGFFYFVILGGVVLLIHLFFGEVVLRTKETCRMPGLARKYLGWWGKVFVTISVVASLFGALLAYLILSGDFLKILLQPWIDLPIAYTALFFWLAMSYFIFRGIKLIAVIELLTNIIFLLATIIIISICLPEFNFQNIKLFDAPNIFLPFGVILFSLIGWSAIPEITEFLKNRNEMKKLKKTIIAVTILVVPFYAIFTLAVLGVVGKNVSYDALSSLSPFLGPKIIILGAIAALITLADSIMVLGVHLKNTLIYDLKIPSTLATIITCGIPLFLFAIGFRSFISVLGIVGTVMGVIEGIAIILIFRKAKKEGNRTPEYSLRVPALLLCFLILVLILGAVSQFLL